MNEIMTASRQTNFYNQDLVRAATSSDNISVQSQNQQGQQVDSNTQSIQQSPSMQHSSQQQSQSQSQVQLQPQQQSQQPPPPSEPQQSQQQMGTAQEIPSTFQPYTSSYQQTRVPKNYLLENTNYYTIQPGFPLVQTSDYYGTSNATTDYQNPINQIISPPFQMSSISTPDTQNINPKAKSQVQSSYQQQVQELFSTPNATSSTYIPVKQSKTLGSNSDQSQQLIPEKFQQQLTSENSLQQQVQIPSQQQQQNQQNQQHQNQQTNAYNNPAFLLYSQQGVPNSAPVSTSSSSSILGTGPTISSNQPSSVQLFQFTYGTSPNQNNTQMYSFQRQQHPQQHSQQQQVLSMPIRNALISSAPGGSIVSTPTMQNKSRNSSLSRTSIDATSTVCGSSGGNQSRATSISSCIPQNEYPERVVRPKVATTRWDDENTNCYQVRARNILVSRREDSNYINGTKLLNVIGMTRGKRDGILKTEKVKNVVKVGSMNLKGVWIPFDRAYEIARDEGVDGLLYPLFVRDIKDYFLTKGHKLKSEDDEQQLEQLHEQQDIEEDDESTSIASSKNSDSKLMETSNVIKSIEEETTGATGVDTSTSTSGVNNSSIVGDVKYVHDYFQRSPQTNTLKEEELYYGSTQNTPLSVPKTL